MRPKSYTDGFFSVDSINGFLPIKQPLITLPKAYSPLQELLTQMPILTDQNQEGLLAREGAIEDYVHKLPNFINQVNLETNPFVQQALFRAYAFVASAYTLAPAYHYYLKHGTYGRPMGNCLKTFRNPLCQ